MKKHAQTSFKGLLAFALMLALISGQLFLLANSAKAAITPATPTGLEADRAGSNYVTWAWNFVSGASYYQILWSKQGYSSFELMNVDGSLMEFTASGLDADTAYQAKIKACSSSVCSAASALALGRTNVTTVTPPPSAPTAFPTGLEADRAGSNYITWVWNSVSDATYYQIYWAKQGWSSFELFNVETGMEYTTSGLDANTSYQAKIKACNTGGCSAVSGLALGKTNVTTVTPPVSTPTIPTTPTGLEADRAGSNYITWVWNSVSDATYYQIYWAKQGWSSFELFNVETGMEYTTSGLDANTSYQAKIKACNSVGCSAVSGLALGKTNVLNIPTAPTLKADSATNNSITWSWGAVNGATYYAILWTKQGWSSFELMNVKNGVLKYVTSGLDTDTSYQAKLRACNSIGCSADSSLIIKKTNTTITSINPTTPTTPTIPTTPTTPTNPILSYSWAVRCQDNNGSVVADSLCSGAKPSIGLQPQTQAPTTVAIDYKLDTDGEGLTDFQEGLYGTDLNKEDTDGDGFDDLTEIKSGYSPLSPEAKKISTNKNKIYGLSRLGDLKTEENAAIVLRDELKALNGGKILTLKTTSWGAVVNAFIYGGYTPQEIFDLAKGNKTAVHPTIPAIQWREQNNQIVVENE